jgi:hypothetical protein
MTRVFYPKSPLVQELVNAFPSWSKIRLSDQSSGYRFLNVFAQVFERMQNKLQRMSRNQYVSTCNLNEVDNLYSVILPANTEFSIDYTDPVNPQPTAPTVSGYLNGDWYNLSVTDDNTLEAFWDNGVPDYWTIETTSTDSHEVCSGLATSFPVSGVYEHCLGGGYFTIETVGGISYFTIENRITHRGQIVLTGVTRKGTEESEVIVFPWDMKQRSKKEWRRLTRIDAYNIEDDVTITVTSADVAQGPYLSFWNNEFSENRNKIDTFYNVDTVTGVTTLDYLRYITDDWRQLVQGFSNQEVRTQWQLLDQSYSNTTMVDMAIQPFSNRAWMIDENGVLYLYDLHDYMVSGLDLSNDKTPGANVQFDIDTPSVILGETMSLIPWHARPIKEVNKFRIWYQTPSGTKYSWIDGAATTYSDDSWVTDLGLLARTVAGTINVTATEYGEYLFVIDTVFVDGQTHTDKVLIPVKWKVPLGQWNLTIPGIILGLDFSADQDLWITSTSGHYQIMPHYNTMLVDYANKIVYFREPFETVGIELDD